MSVEVVAAVAKEVTAVGAEVATEVAKAAAEGTKGVVEGARGVAEGALETSALDSNIGDIPAFVDKTPAKELFDIPQFEKDLDIPNFAEIGGQVSCEVFDIPQFEKDFNISNFAEGEDQTCHIECQDSLIDGSGVKTESSTDEISKVRDVPQDENVEYLSSYDERLKQTPSEGDRGSWTGNRGESKYISTDKEVNEILAEYGMDGVSYEDGIPDFSKCSEATVEIDDMSSNRNKNFEQCDEKCAEKWNEEARDGKTDWAARDVANWRRENHYSWHECNDRKTCQLVPTKVNDYFGHFGGVGECNIAEKKQEELFDE